MNRSVAILVVGMLGILLVFAATQHFVTIATPPRSGAAKTAFILKDVSAQLDLFREHCGRYPTAEEGLASLLARPESPELTEKWLGPYIKGAVADGWGRDLRYEMQTAGTYRIWSFGLDGCAGTADDLAVSKP